MARVDFPAPDKPGEPQHCALVPIAWLSILDRYAVLDAGDVLRLALGHRGLHVERADGGESPN